MITFLVVDDSKLIRIQVAQALKNEGHKILEAKNAEEAFELVTKFVDEIDLIICDQNMPRKSGLELISDLRSTFDDKDLKILMLTTETDQDLKDRGTELDVLAWLIKPFNSDVFLEALGAILEE